MTAADIIEFFGIFLLSAVKFGIAGVPAAVFAKYSFLETVFATCGGGITGVVVFTYLSEWLLRLSKKVIKHKKPKKKFTITNKIIVKVKRSFGLMGISVISPLLLSIPLGAFLGVRFYHNKRLVISYMSISVIIWSVLLYFFYHNLIHSISAIFN